jgi:hypothetical protein
VMTGQRLVLPDTAPNRAGSPIITAPFESPLCLPYLPEPESESNIQQEPATIAYATVLWIISCTSYPTPPLWLFSLSYILDSYQDPCSTRWPSEALARASTPDHAGNPATPP